MAKQEGQIARDLQRRIEEKFQLWINDSAELMKMGDVDYDEAMAFMTSLMLHGGAHTALAVSGSEMAFTRAAKHQYELCKRQNEGEERPKLSESELDDTVQAALEELIKDALLSYHQSNVPTLKAVGNTFSLLILEAIVLTRKAGLSKSVALKAIQMCVDRVYEVYGEPAKEEATIQ